MKIKVFSDFCTSEICKSKFESSCKAFMLANYGPDKEIFITIENDYTHAIILNTSMPKLEIDKKFVIGFACEPVAFLRLSTEFIAYAEKNIGKYYIGDLNGLGKPFIEHHGFMWFEHPFQNIKNNKKKLISIIFSEKKFAPGHIYRRTLVSYILNNNLPIDIFGRGCQFLSEPFKSRPNMKGMFDNTEPYDDYVFTISIENFICSQYFSEKIITPIMCETIPIYLGCKNIDKYVKDFYIPMSGVLKNDIELILDVLHSPFKYINKVKTSKDDVFLNINMLHNIKKIFTL